VADYLHDLTDIQQELAPGATLVIDDSTVIGKVHAQTIEHASNTLFVAALRTGGDAWRAPVWAERRQEGCVRFCFVPPGAIVPRRFKCQPESDGAAGAWPHFTSLRYGNAGYCQLAASTAQAIRRGADDEGEIGVLHSLFQPQRESNLKTRLEEYLRYGLEAGIFYAT
jgi:hypothetical protein